MIDGGKVAFDSESPGRHEDGVSSIPVAEIAEMLVKEHSQAIHPDPRIPTLGQPINLHNPTTYIIVDEAHSYVDSARKRRIALPPGVRLSAAARAVLTPRAYRRHVMVAVSEMQAEYIEEIRAGNDRTARLVSIRGHMLILWTLLRAALPARVRAFLSG